MGWVCGVMIIVQLINIVFSVLDILDRFQRDSDPVNTKSIKTYHFLTHIHPTLSHSTSSHSGILNTDKHCTNRPHGQDDQ